MGLLALALALVAFLSSWIPFLGIPLGLVLGIGAVAVGAIAAVRVPSRALGVVALVLGILTLLLKLTPGVNFL